MPPLATRKERAPAKDPLIIALEELDAPFKSTQEAKRKNLILALALLFTLDLLFFLACHAGKSPTGKPLETKHSNRWPSRQDTANFTTVEPIRNQLASPKINADNSDSTDRPPAIDSANQVYFTHLALDRAHLAARQDRLELENIYFQSLKSNLSESQLKNLKEMQSFRKQDLQLQEERINKLKAALKAQELSGNPALL